MSTTLATVLLVVACVLVGLATYVLDAPGRAARGTRAQRRRRAQDRGLEEAEARFQARRAEEDLPPTHQQP